MEKRGGYLLAVAGEASGDAHGGFLLQALKQRLAELSVCGVGGPAMQRAGLRPLYPLSALEVIGLWEVLWQWPRLRQVLQGLIQHLERDPPCALLLVDYPGFNLRLAQAARERGIPVFLYGAPQVWAWRGKRIHTVARVVDALAVLFPFEEALFRRAGVNARFFGHPLVEAPGTSSVAPAASAWATEWDSASGPLVALMPGSRPGELRQHLLVLLETVHCARAKGFAARYAIPVAPTLSAAEIRKAVYQQGLQGQVAVLEHAFHPLLQAAKLALVASGTATLQCALAGLPMLVFYRVNPLTYALARHLAYQPYISMVNILAAREVVPEYIQTDCTAERLSTALIDLARDPLRMQAMRKAFASVTAGLGSPGAYARAADWFVEQLLNSNHSSASRAPEHNTV